MKRIQLATLLVLTLFSCNKSTELYLDLSGEWQFAMDTLDTGESEKWYDTNFDDFIRLPGSMAGNGKGFDISLDTRWTGGIQNPEWFLDSLYKPYHDPENIRFPYWLQPLKKYTGAAWYRTSFTLSDDWNDKVVNFEMERPHWESTIWVNGQSAGTQNSLATAHKYNITPYLKPGLNTLAVRIDNRTSSVDVGENSHSISDHTQSNWNGITGRIGLSGRSRVYIDHVDVYPDIENSKVSVRLSIINTTEEAVSVEIPVRAVLKNTGSRIQKEEFETTAVTGKSEFVLDYHLGGDISFWDEFHPNVYQLDVHLKSDYGTDSRTTDFGMREFRVSGTRFTINNTPVFLRGTLECAIFPETGYPPADTGGWMKVFRAVRAHGLNHVRFHSWCPPEAAFAAADQLGVYLQVECSSWANQSTQLGSGLPIDQYIYDESHRIVSAYGNHPSFVMMAYGNEPGGPSYAAYLTDFVEYWKDRDDRRVYTGAAGWPVISANEYHNIPEPRIQRWGEELGSIINAQPPASNYDWSERIPGDGKPVVSHEIGQWCVYPDFKEIDRYTGVLKARNFELFQESLEAHHLGHLADSFLLASGKLQALCYKADIEAALRTPGFAGFHLLDLHDFPGQGTALVGVLNPFWEEKGYITPEEYSRFCNEVVPLARLSKMIFTEGEVFEADIELAYFGSENWFKVNPQWSLSYHGITVAKGEFGLKEVSWGNGHPLGRIEWPIPLENNPRMLTLEVKAGAYANSWDIWIYPEDQGFENEQIWVVETLDASVLDFLAGGGKVLLSLGKGKVATNLGGKVGVGFSTIFWNTAWTGNQKPHTLGILCNPSHPALREFPTQYHSNWQWWDAMTHADAIQIDGFPTELKPIVRIIDDWVSNRSLALIFEAKVGEGKIVVSGADLIHQLDNRPEARQLRKSLLSYMTGEDFNPETELSPAHISEIIK